MILGVSVMTHLKLAAQDIKELGIKVAENREFTNADAVATKVAVVGKVIARFLPIEALDWLAGMSLWHSFTAEQSKRQDDKSTSEQWEKVGMRMVRSGSPAGEPCKQSVMLAVANQPACT